MTHDTTGPADTRPCRRAAPSPEKKADSVMPARLYAVPDDPEPDENPSEHAAPADLDAERAVIGAAMLSAATLTQMRTLNKSFPRRQCDTQGRVVEGAVKESEVATEGSGAGAGATAETQTVAGPSSDEQRKHVLEPSAGSADEGSGNTELRSDGLAEA